MQTPEYFSKKNFVPRIDQKPSEKLNICVVLPSYNEANLDKSLQSLLNCKKPFGDVEVIVVINHPEGSLPEVVIQSEESVALVNRYNALSDTKVKFHSIKAYNLPLKHAGVGLARQIGMDEAAYRLFSVGNSNGIVACFDADATCELNFLFELENLWNIQPKTTACSIRYEHPISGNEFKQGIYEGIAGYELHLRYYNQASRYINFPFSYHTIGSSMASSAATYIKFGGMNRHQAGEDFYFLQKIIPHGNFRELNSTCIYPSPRPSTRVPFGTGRAMMKYLENTAEGIKTYNLNSFLDLIPLFTNVDKIWDFDDKSTLELVESLPKGISTFLLENNAVNEIRRVKDNTANQKSFRKRFFLWFDAFMLLKYLNYSNEKFYSRECVQKESIKLGKLIGLPVEETTSIPELLRIYREKDLEEWNPKF